MLAPLPPSDSSPLGVKRSAPHMATASTSSKEVQAELKKGTERQESSDNNTPTEVGALQSFAHGALGLAEPKTPEPLCVPETPPQEGTQGYYKAGQLLKAAATVGSVIALFV